MVRDSSSRTGPDLRPLFGLGVLAYLGIALSWTGMVRGDGVTTCPLPMTGCIDCRLVAFDELLQKFMQERQIPGAALAISRNGRLVYSRGFGYADRELCQPVEPESLFRVASISKVITSVAVLQLVEQGKLSLDDHVVDLLQIDPWLPEGAQPDPRLKQVTIRHLLQHTGGWDREATSDPMFESVEIAGKLGVPAPAQPLHVIRYMFGRPLDFDPGARHAYSNFGFCLLGRVVEKLSGESYEAFVQKRVLQPVGVTRMRLGRTRLAERAPGEVRYYTPKDETSESVLGGDSGKQVLLPYGCWYLEAMDSHGAWIASAVDLLKFASAFDHPESSPLLRQETIQGMFARPEGLAGFEADGKPKDSYCGLGWFVRPKGAEGRANHWHTGSLDGTSTLLVRRHDGVSMAILFNTRSGTKEKVPARAIDPLLHAAVERIKDWPEGEPLLGRQQGGTP